MVEIEVRPETTDEQLGEIKREFTPVLLKDVLKDFTVEEHLILNERFASLVDTSNNCCFQHFFATVLGDFDSEAEQGPGGVRPTSEPQGNLADD
jgi:hypothetical protein